jgi:protein-S-isoprenylcysteine O-methyltransferase Ste14
VVERVAVTAEAGGMTGIHPLLNDLTQACLQIVGIAWLVAAGYFALRRPMSWRARLWQFLRTLLPEPWLLIALPLIAILTGSAPPGVWAHLRFWNPVLATIGFVIVVASTALMLWARWVLGTMWAGRPLVQQDHRLCTDGPYRIVRHPIYTGIVGLALGGTLVAGFGRMLVVVSCTVVFAVWRVRVEDRMMTATFGRRYDTYRREVPALMPVTRPRLP